MKCLWLTACFLIPLQAQEPFFMEAATHPAKGNQYSRIRVFDRELHLSHASGLSSRLALLADVRGEEEGFSGADVRGKFQILRKDTSPLDTWRTSLQAGASWRESGSASARIGLVSTLIRSRHGFNVQADLNGAEPSGTRGELNASYLFRLFPARYDAQTHGAWYLMFEALQDVSSGWDIHPEGAVGLLFEAHRWALEVSLRQQDSDVEAGVGARVLW